MRETRVMERLFHAHARLKQRIHAFRLPIHTRAGRFAVGVVYFTVPCVVGLGMLQLTNVIRDDNLGKNREKLIERQKAWQADDAAVASGSSGGVPRPLVMAVTPTPRVVPQNTRVL